MATQQNRLRIGFTFIDSSRQRDNRDLRYMPGPLQGTP
jgi:hypothetical protein